MHERYMECMHDGNKCFEMNAGFNIHKQAALNLTAHFWKFGLSFCRAIDFESKLTLIRESHRIKNQLNQLYIFLISLIKCTIFQYLPFQFVKKPTEFWGKKRKNTMKFGKANNLF